MTAPAKEWFSAAELAAEKLPGMPSAKSKMITWANREHWQRPETKDTHWRTRTGRGGGIEYNPFKGLPAFPVQALTTLGQRYPSKIIPADAAAEKASFHSPGAWNCFDRQKGSHKDIARQRLATVLLVEDLMKAGYGKVAACVEVDKSDRLAVLAPAWRSNTPLAECEPTAWEFLTGLYLRLSGPTFEQCWRDVAAKAKQEGWRIPSKRTLQRRIENIPEKIRVLYRCGEDALRQMYPAQERDRSGFHAMEAVNADGHRFDVFVKWPDGSIARPMMVGFQDLYSGMILSYRVARSEHKLMVQLAFGDMVERYSIPDECWLDNGRAFAAKWLTGGTPNRYRFKVKDEEPVGIMTALGVKVHWTTPYHGQSKPIERAWRDLASDVSKDVRFEGAYCGNNVMAKPENYGSRAIPLADFERVLAERIAEHNARPARGTKVCSGRLSFQDAFLASYQEAKVRLLITHANEAQSRLWLMAAEQVRVDPKNGMISLMGNRYWDEGCLRFLGKRVTVRFDPEDLHAGLHVYNGEGQYQFFAKVHDAVGFADVEAGREHARDVARFVKGTKEAAKVERRLSLEETVAITDSIQRDAPTTPEPTVVRPMFGTAPRKSSSALPQQSDDEKLLVAGLERWSARRRQNGGAQRP
jgi:hypothetical protein